MAGIQLLPAAESDPLSTKFVRWGIGAGPISEMANLPEQNSFAIGPKISRRYRWAFKHDRISGARREAHRPFTRRTARNADNPNADYPGQVGWSASNTFAWAINENAVAVNVSNSKGIYSFILAGNRSNGGWLR